MVLVVVGFAFFLVREERAQRRAEFDLRVNVTSAAIRLAVENALRTGKLAEVERLAKDLVVKQTEIVRIRLLDRDLATESTRISSAGSLVCRSIVIAPSETRASRPCRAPEPRHADPHGSAARAVVRERRRRARGRLRRRAAGSRSARRELQDRAAGHPPRLSCWAPSSGPRCIVSC
jgi:hypothetical protein